MTKKNLIFLLGILITLSVTGCGSKSTPETEAPAAEEEVIDESEEWVIEYETETEEVLEPITPESYLISNVEQYITLSSMDKLAAVQYTYELTDEAFQERIQMELEECAEEETLERPSQTGDLVYADIVINKDEEESFYFRLGDAENGEEFDKQLTGISIGEQKSFSVTFGDDIWRDDWIGQTVNFDVTVTDVAKQILPEYNDQYVSDYTEFETIQEYEKHLRETMLQEYELMSISDVYQSLLEQVQDHAIFSDIPDELQKECEAEILHSYKLFFGDDATMEDITNLFGYTEDQLANDAVPMAQRRLVVEAICQQNNLTVTSDEYFTYLKEQADYYGNPSAGDYEDTATRSTIVWELYEKKAAQFLYESAVIKQTPYVEEDVEEIDEEA